MEWETVTNWGNNNALIIQAVATVVLVAVTAFYAIRTHDIAKQTASMARLEFERQREAVRPVLVFKALSTSGPQPGLNRNTAEFEKSILIRVTNRGIGPALEARIRWARREGRFIGGDPSVAAKLVPQPQPFVLAADAHEDFEVRWTATAHLTLGSEERVVSGFDREQALNLGRLTASYRDIYGRTLESSGDVEIQMLEGDQLPRVSGLEHRVVKEPVR